VRPDSGEFHAVFRRPAAARDKNLTSALTAGSADGTIDGASFSFTSAVTAEQKFEGNVVIGDASNLTLNVDAASWFTANGSRLDPRSESNRAQIENNIQKSFQAFEDDDHDGHQDP
jgi:uncharacterized phage protein gp47/JayE